MENVKKCVGIIALKAERTQIYFLSDVLVAIALLDLKVLIFFLTSLIYSFWIKWGLTKGAVWNDPFKYIVISGFHRSAQTRHHSYPKDTRNCNKVNKLVTTYQIPNTRPTKIRPTKYPAILRNDITWHWVERVFSQCIRAIRCLRLLRVLSYLYFKMFSQLGIC